MNFQDFKKSQQAKDNYVQVVTFDKGSQWFSNFKDAKTAYPALDIDKSTDKFTWAMRGDSGNNRMALRFESFKMYDILSR